ncbi:MAG: low molecular weight phosphotyrosine protein phosphatase [Deltaproteobacteria bacterium]|nr:low molecular weight phosphotyrosine protein phosphatase [Deltaproteobacteria bacterium]
MQRLLFVCLGNICRSPTAEAVFAELLRRAGRMDEFQLDSAGTGDWHAGEPPDLRTQAAARALGYPMRHRARQVSRQDFERFDLVLAMDRQNHRDLLALADPVHHPKIQLFRSLDDPGSPADVPDPYYGGEEGFVEVVRIVERVGGRWLEKLGR